MKINIEGLSIEEIGDKIKEFLPSFLKEKFRFQENYQLEFNEISHAIPAKYHNLFDDNDIINSASGCAETDDSEYNYTIILLSNSDYSRASFLLLQKEHKITGDIQIELLTAFVLAEIDKNTSDNIVIEKLGKYQTYLLNVKNFIETKKNKLKNKKTVESLKKRLLELIRQTMDILEEFY